MRWFAAALVFEAKVSDMSGQEPLREISIRVLRANDKASAREMAEAMRTELQHEYTNEDGAIVRWTGIAILDVQDISEREIEEGTEVFSIMYRRGNLGSFDSS